MKKPVPPSNFLTRDSYTQVDLRRLRDAWQDLLNWIDANKGTVDLSAYDTITGNNARYLLRAAADFATFATKATPVAADVILLEDSAAAGAKKKATLNTLATAIGAAVQIGGSNPLWATPATLGLSPGTFDKEFDSTTIPAGLVIWDNGASTTRTISGNTSLTTLPGAGSVFGDAHTTNGGRASWLRIQAPTTNAILSCGWPVTVPSTVVFWTRMKTMNNVPNTAQALQLFALYADSSGHPDRNNYVSIGFASGLQQLQFECKLGGTNQSGSGTSGTGFAAQSATYEYFWIFKDGSVSPARYTIWAGAADGVNVSAIASFQPSGFTPAWLGFDLRGPSGVVGVGGAVASRFDFDFIRQTTATFMF